MALITDKLRGVMAVDPTAEVIEFQGVWYSWGRLASVIEGIEGVLDRLGLPVDARVAVLLRNRPGHIAAAISVLSTDRCLVTLNPLLPDEKLFGDISGLDLPVIIGEAADLQRPGMAEALDAAGAAVIEIDPLLKGAHLAAGRETPRGGVGRLAEGVAIEMLTSGTTGTPKRVPLTRKAFDASFAGVTRYEKGRDFNDKPRLRSGTQIVVNPITHIGGIYGVIGGLMAGRKMCLLERFTVQAWADAIERHKPTVAPGVPAALKMVLEAGVPREKLASLRAIISGTAPLDPDVVDQFYEKYGIPILANYGATEFAGAICGWSIEDFHAHWKQKRGSAGRIHADMEARIVDPETGEPRPRGVEGVLELKGAQLGEHKGWLRTTDRAVLDQDDFLFSRGRADNAIVRGGFKIHPDEVVRALDQHPAVREASVVGIPDERLGQVPAAAIILREGASPPSPEELTAFLKAKLLPYQVPTRFVFVKDLPRTASMKPALQQITALFA